MSTQRQKEQSPRAEGWGSGGERERERERESPGDGWRERARPLAPLFMFFSSPGACPMQIGLSQELCSTWSPHSGPQTFLDLPLFYFRRLPLPCLLATAILDSFSLF